MACVSEKVSGADRMMIESDTTMPMTPYGHDVNEKIACEMKIYLEENSKIDPAVHVNVRSSGRTMLTQWL